MKVRIAVSAAVVLVVAAGLVLWPTLRGNAVGTPVHDSSVRFRIVGTAPAQPDPSVFTVSSYVVPNHRAAKITEVVLQNPHHDAGTMRIQIGADVLLEVDLADVRTEQFHLPLQVRADQPVSVAVSCQLPGPPEPAAGTCAPAASFFG